MQTRQLMASLAALLMIAPAQLPAANHREAPITAIDRLADIADWFTFVSYENPNRVVMILNVDPLLEPSNGPNYFPFDQEIAYDFHVDNNRDAIPDVTFRVRFTNDFQLPGVFTALVGAGNGVPTPADAPNPKTTGLVVPPAITALDGPGSQGIGLRQVYRVQMIRNGVVTDLTNAQRLYAVPANAGPRTMPDYAALARQGVYTIANGIRVFAGTVDDPFYIDLGATFDSLNLRDTGSGIPGVLTQAQDADDTRNFAPDHVRGFNVNTIALEVPIEMLTRTGRVETASSPDAVLGTYGQTSRPRVTTRRSPDPLLGSGGFQPVQRMGNALFNELLIGTGSKDRFSMSLPQQDSQFSNFYLDPLLARALNAIYTPNLPVPDAPRLDLAPLVTYAPPIAPDSMSPGPLADLLRINTGIRATPASQRRRLGFIAGDTAGYPNGRRVSDDVTDISLRAVVGILTGQPRFTGFPHNILGDGVNTNDLPYQEVFPYVAFSQSGRDRVH